jgi:hypothetical protein
LHVVLISNGSGMVATLQRREGEEEEREERTPLLFSVISAAGFFATATDKERL